MVIYVKINLEMTTKLNLATICPLTFLMHLDRLQDINSTVNWNIIRSSTSLLVKEAFFLLF